MKTADGWPITNGMRVIDNDMKVGTVDLQYKEPFAEKNQNNGTEEWWFYIQRDGERLPHLTSESRVATRDPFTGRRIGDKA